MSVAQLELAHDRSSVVAMVKRAKYYLEGNKEAAVVLFRKVAREGDGELSAKQFRGALHLLGLDLDNSDFRNLWTYLDLNSDTKITPNELINGLELNFEGVKKTADMCVRPPKYTGRMVVVCT
jgi:hypothetical protein